MRTGQRDGSDVVGWSVVNTQPQREGVATANLERQGFRVYCPLVRRRHAHARRVTEVLRPLFPGYVFVAVGTGEHRWRPILSTRGVRTIVSCGDEFSLIDDGFVRSLKDREVDGAISRPAVPYTVGQEIRIAGGPFDGLVATIIEMHDRERLTVLLQLLNRRVRVKIETAQIEP